MLRLNPERLATQVIRADLAFTKLKLEQEEGLTGFLTGISFLPYIKNKIQIREKKIFY